MGTLPRPENRWPFDVQRIAIIGAGPSGLATAKYLLAEGAFNRIDIFEQQSEVGGCWNYTPDVTGTISIPQNTPWVPPDEPIWREREAAPVFSNPMYDQLHTNIPKDLMKFSEQPFPEQSLLFPSREDVQDYLVKYSRDIRRLICFSKQVQAVHSFREGVRLRWELTYKSTITGQEKKSRYDAVVVASGHYSVPFIPVVPGIKEFGTTYPGTITHSKIYRSSKPFTNKKVIVVGSAASGLDIGLQISKVCRKPLLNSVRTSSPLKLGQENKEEVPQIVEYLIKDKSVRFEDGRIEKDIDAIVYCTGYLYSYPFLSADIRTRSVLSDGRRVRGTYKQLFHRRYPTLAFTALPQKVIPFPISEVQAAAISKVWSNKLLLPRFPEMKRWEEEEVEKLGSGTSFHVLGWPLDAEYINDMHNWVMSAGNDGKDPAYWGEEQLWVRERYAEIRKKFVEEGSHARTMSELGFIFRKSHQEIT